MAAQDSNRKSERIPFPRTLQVRKPAAQSGKGLDIAAGGIGLEVPQAIPEGSPVELDLGDGGTALVGTVKLTRPVDGGFRVGVQFAQEDAAIVARAQALLAK
jgi:hypothetical protein